MTIALPVAGAANDEIARVCQQTWIETAMKAGIDLTGFDSSAPLAERIAWARARNLEIGAILSRYSSKLQHSTASQVRDCTEYAACHHIYVPPEYVCVDEAVSGRKSRRDGLDRMKSILEHRLADVLLVFKLSRLLRAAYKSFQFFQEEVVEAGLRGISISQGIDTADAKVWKALCILHGLMDEMLLETIADHVRSGLKNLFREGFCVGRLTLGYRTVEVPGGRPTNLGRPRTIPAIDPETAKLLKQHFEWIRDGMPIKEGWRRWVKAGGPCYSRSSSRRMSYPAYRRMLSNLRYTGRWAFGRKRNVWKGKLNYIVAVAQPDTEVVFSECEELRIIGDELFFAVQKRLESLKMGPRGPKRRKEPQLWDLVTEVFFCARCDVRFYQSGARGTGMTCKHGDLCPCKSVVKRKEAVSAVCEKLYELIQRDSELIQQIVACAEQIDAAGDESIRVALTGIAKRIVGLTNKIDDLAELAGQGADEDRTKLKSKIQSAQIERADLRHREVELRQQLDHAANTITAERVREILSDFRKLLEDASAGKLGTDVVYRAAAVFRQLVGERILVYVEKRPKRIQTNVRGVFQTDLIRSVQSAAGVPRSAAAPEVSDVEVWLRPRSKRDLLADRAYQLVDVEHLSLREAAAALKAEGVTPINSGIVWQARHRWHEMHGLEMPRKFTPRSNRKQDNRESA